MTNEPEKARQFQFGLKALIGVVVVVAILRLSVELGIFLCFMAVVLVLAEPRQNTPTSKIEYQPIVGPALGIIGGLYFLSFFLPFDSITRDGADAFGSWASDMKEGDRAWLAHPMFWLGLGFFICRQWRRAFVASLSALALGLMEARNIYKDVI